jgi:hypothetical protein
MRIFILMWVLLVVSSNAVAVQEVIRLECTEFLPSYGSLNKVKVPPGYIEIQSDIIILKSIRGFDGTYAKSSDNGAEFNLVSPNDEHLWGKLDRYTGRLAISTFDKISHDFTSEIEGSKYWEGVCRPVQPLP